MELNRLSRSFKRIKCGQADKKCFLQWETSVTPSITFRNKAA